ncbi:MAG: hypothetical protein V3U92_14495 [Cellulophaga sp.]
MFKKAKLSLLVLGAVIVFYNCSSDDSEGPKYLDNLIGSWIPVVGLMTGEIVNGDYGEKSFTYNFGECNREKGRLTFNKDGSLDFIRYKGKLEQGCHITESSKEVTWNSVGDSTFIAQGIISQLNAQGLYDEKDIFNIAYEPYLDVQPDLVNVKNDTLILFYDKIPKTNLYTTRFFYVKTD